MTLDGGTCTADWAAMNRVISKLSSSLISVVTLAVSASCGACAQSDDVSEGNLNVTGTGSLEMTGQDGGDVVSYFTDVTIGSGLYLQTNEPGTHWYGQSFSASGNVISSLTITPDVYYPIWVISSDKVHYIQVSGENKGHVLGESNTTVTYDSDSAVRTPQCTHHGLGSSAFARRY